MQLGDTDLLVEVTGTDLNMVVLALNIFASNLADRGATIEAVDIAYPYETEFGTTVKTPLDMNQSQRISLDAIEKALVPGENHSAICVRQIAPLPKRFDACDGCGGGCRHNSGL